jgi:predicted cobalt transporter CbtA
MSATTRSIEATPSYRPLVAAFAAIMLAVALVLLLAYAQLAGSQATTAPLNPGAQNAHDHGWSTAPAAGAAPVTNDRGWATAPSTQSAPVGTGTGGGNGTRFAR